MKNWNWKKWTAFAIVILVVIAAVVLHLVQPEISFAFAELIFALSFIVGGIAGWLGNDKIKD